MRRWPAAALVVGLLACAEADPVAPEPPPPPLASLDGTWRFVMTVTWTDMPCLYWFGRVYTPTIKISQAGTTVIAEGFMGLLQNEMTGTIDSERRVLLSGHYPEEGYITTIHQTLTWDGGEALTGTGTWEWTGLNRQCPRGQLSITATREE